MVMADNDDNIKEEVKEEEEAALSAEQWKVKANDCFKGV